MDCQVYRSPAGGHCPDQGDRQAPANIQLNRGRRRTRRHVHGRLLRETREPMNQERQKRQSDRRKKSNDPGLKPDGWRCTAGNLQKATEKDGDHRTLPYCGKKHGSSNLSDFGREQRGGQAQNCCQGKNYGMYRSNHRQATSIPLSVAASIASFNRRNSSAEISSSPKSERSSRSREFPKNLPSTCRTSDLPASCSATQGR